MTDNNINNTNNKKNNEILDPLTVNYEHEHDQVQGLNPIVHTMIVQMQFVPELDVTL